MSDSSIPDPGHDCIIIDDEPVACERLKEILEDFDALEVRDCHYTYQEALESLLSKRPGIVFVDVELDKNHTAFELIDELHKNCYFPYIILITAFEHYSIKAIKKSVFDYLVKPIDRDEFRETMDRLQKHMSTPFSSLVVTNDMLSTREKEVLELVLKGSTSREIADQLSVSKSTIDSHRKNILKKTGARSASDLMRTSRLP